MHVRLIPGSLVLPINLEPGYEATCYPAHYTLDTDTK